MMRQQFRQDRQQHSTYYIHRYIHIYISMYILHTILEVECGIQSVLPVTMVGCTTLDFLAGSVWTSGTLVGFTILKKRKKKSNNCEGVSPQLSTEHESEESQTVNQYISICLYLEQIPLNPSDQS